MRAQARASHMVTLSFALVMAVSSSASAMGESERRPSRGPKHERDEPTRPEPRYEPRSEEFRRSPDPPARRSPSASRPVPTSARPGAERPRGGTSQALDNGGTRPGSDPNAGGPGVTGPSSRPASASPSGRPSGGSSSRPRGSSRIGNGGNRSRSAPGDGAGHAPADSTGGPARFRIGPAGPPSGRDRLAVGVARPTMAWGSSRAPKAALMSSGAILAPAVVLPSTAEVNAAAVGPPTPLPRTGTELSPSAVLALMLLALGKVLRRTAR